MLREFREFAMQGSMLDMAIGIIIGGAFGTVVQSVVSDVIMPPIGLLLGGVDFADFFIVLAEGTPAAPYATLAAADAAGAVTLNYGLFVNALVSFLIVAFAVFLLVGAINRLRRQQAGAQPGEPTSKDCPYCCSLIPVKATRCPQCTSEVPA